MILRALLAACIASILLVANTSFGSLYNQISFMQRYDPSSASKNTDSSVFYTEIETKILNTDSDPKNTDRDPIIRVIAIHIYYCMTGRAIWGNIQFEAGSIGPSAARDNTEAEN